jgi:hypothetical protein
LIVYSLTEMGGHSVIESFAGRQDNVVFMGRRSFRMEIAGGPGGNELAIPLGASSMPTERIFASDRQLALEPTWLRRSPRRSATTTRTVVLCTSAFAFGILLTWAFNRWAAGERVRAALPVAVAPAPSPASEAVIVQLPPPTALAQPALDEPKAVEQAISSKTAKTLSALALEGSRLRPPVRTTARLSRPAAIRAPKLTRTARAAPPVDQDADAPPPAKPWVDPFAE